jgi:hypothetical protein
MKIELALYACTSLKTEFPRLVDHEIIIRMMCVYIFINGYIPLIKRGAQNLFNNSSLDKRYRTFRGKIW